jgi:hypothetical protein
VGFIKDYLNTQRNVVLGMAALDCYLKLIGADAKVIKTNDKGLNFVIKDEDYSAHISLEHRVLTFKLNVPGIKEKEVRNELGFFENYFVERSLKSIYEDYVERQKVNG